MIKFLHVVHGLLLSSRSGPRLNSGLCSGGGVVLCVGSGKRVNKQYKLL